MLLRNKENKILNQKWLIFGKIAPVIFENKWQFFLILWDIIMLCLFVLLLDYYFLKKIIDLNLMLFRLVV